MKNKLIDFTITTLFATNIFILIYATIITTLNFYFPPAQTVNFFRPAVAFPERFEMPLFLILTILFATIIAWLSTKSLLKIDLPAVIKIILLAGLFWLLITKLGAYPLSADNSHFSGLTLFLYLAVLTVILIESFLLEKVSSGHKIFLYLIILFITAVLVFEPRFITSPLEYAFFLGPIWEVMQGKTLFTDVPSQYGFLSILFFGGLLKTGLFSFSQLPVYIFLLQVLQYFLCFYLIYKVSKSSVLALLGLFSIITINYLSFHVPPLSLAQYGALRRIPFLLALYLMYRFKKLDSKQFIFSLAVLSFWTVDIGIQLLLAYSLTLFYQFLAGLLDIKKILKTAFILTSSLTGIFLLIQFLHLLAGYKLINPLEIILTLRQYAGSGIGMLPMQTQTYFWIVIFTYFGTLIFFFQNGWQPRKASRPASQKLQRGEQRTEFFHPEQSRMDGSSTGGNESADRVHFENILLIFSANISLFSSLYFVGRSDDYSLIVISIFPLLNLFLLLGQLLKQSLSGKLKIVLYVLLFTTFVVLPAYNRRSTLTGFLTQKYQGWKSEKPFRTKLDEDLQQRFAAEINLIGKNIKEEEVLLLSSDDSYLFYLTDKKNLLDENPQSGIESIFEMELAMKNVKKACPKRIVVDCSVIGRCPNFVPFTKGWTTAGYILNELEKSCNLKYQPVDCTDELCIAEIK